jgi:hypothetical protein
MTNIIYRSSSTQIPPVSSSVKGSELTIAEFDANLKSISNSIESKVAKSDVAGDGAFIENLNIVSVSYTITVGKNAVSAGPIVINDGVVVTVPVGSTWVVV